MSQLPVDRTTNNTVSEHLADHNELHRLHDVWDGHAPSDFNLDSRRVWTSGNLVGLASDKYVGSTSTSLGASVTYTLPDATTVPDGHIITISDEGQGINGANIIIVSPFSGDTITPNFAGISFVPAKGGKSSYVKSGGVASHLWTRVSELPAAPQYTSGTGISISGSNVISLTTGTTPTDGWIQDSATWTQTGALTFTVTGDVRNYLKKGTKIKVNDTTIKYFVIGNSTFGSPNTTVTLIDNDDYALVATPTSTWFSRMPDPEGFPFWFNYTTNATITGFSAIPTNVIQRWSTIGRMITMNIVHSTAGTSNATGYTITLPIQATGISNIIFGGTCYRATDNSTGVSPQPYWQITSGGTVVSFLLGVAGTWTNSGTKRASAIAIWEF